MTTIKWAWWILPFALQACSGRVESVSSSHPTHAIDAGTTDGTPPATPSGAKCSAPVQLVDFRALPTSLGVGASPLAVDATHVYFSFDDSLMSVPILGGPAVTMLRLATPPHVDVQLEELLLVSRNVILHSDAADGTNEQIVSVPTNGRRPVTLALSVGRVFGIAADADNVYFIDDAGLKSVGEGSGITRLLTDRITSKNRGTFFGNTLAVVGSNLIAVGDGTVASIPLAGGPPTTLATGQPNPSFPLPCGVDTCWWAGDTPPGVAGSPGPGRIMRRRADGTVEKVADAPFFPWSLAFDGVDFFETVGCDVCDGTLLRIPASGGPEVEMAPASFVTVDDTCAYWSTRAGVFKAPKSYSDRPR